MDRMAERLGVATTLIAAASLVVSIGIPQAWIVGCGLLALGGGFGFAVQIIGGIKRIPVPTPKK